MFLFVMQLTSILCSNMIPFAEFQCTYNTLCFIFPELPNIAVNPMKKAIFKELYDYINRNSS